MMATGIKVFSTLGLALSESVAQFAGVPSDAVSVPSIMEIETEVQ